MIAKLALPFRSIEFGGYFTVSVVALAVDVVTLLVAARFMHYLLAATVAFSVGAMASYFLAVRWVFSHRSFAKRPLKEFGAYILIGIVGLGINNLTIFVAVETATVALPLAKAFAAGATFFFNYAGRKLFLFSK